MSTDDSSLLVSTKSKSGFKYVIFDSRSRSRMKPWSVNYRGYRSRGFARPVEAAKHLVEIMTPKVSSQTVGAAPPLPKPTKHPPDAWIKKKGVRFNTKACNMFGARIRMHGRLAVIKSWTPSSHTFGIVFDDNPDKVFYEDLVKQSKTWNMVDWEGDVWETQELRPMCPTCGHPLDVGLAAWTKCVPCGQMEPGASSTAMFSRLRNGDPYRCTV